MEKLFLTISICILSVMGLDCKAQYAGGSSFGFSSTALLSSACALPANSNVYFGGASNPASSSMLQSSICPLAASSSIYFGGYGGGNSLAIITTSVCSLPASSNIYFGGDAGGNSTSILAASICPLPASTSIYFGGDADGFSSGAFISAVCPLPANTNIYFGGAADGYSPGIYINTLSSCSLLPVALLSFAGTCSDQGRLLKWTTSAEINSRDFNIEYSSDQTNWLAAGTIAAAGNSTTTRNYSFKDSRPHTGTVFYRLKQTDLDSRSAYSKIISVGDCDGDKQANLGILPNPSAGEIFLTFTGDKTKVNSIEIYNVLGERVFHSGTYIPRIDLSGKPAGVYFINFSTPSKMLIEKLLIER